MSASHRLGRALGMHLPGGPHPAHDTQLAGPGDHHLGIDPAAGDRAQSLVTPSPERSRSFVQCWLDALAAGDIASGETS